MSAEQRYRATIHRIGGKAFVPLPFHPDEVWGAKARHCLSGTIGGRTWRGTVTKYGETHGLPIGPAWTRDNGLGAGDEVEVAVRPEGPQIDSLADDLRTAIEASPQALAFFGGLTTFDRNNYMRWIDSAKRPETRMKRIVEMVRRLENQARL